MEALTGVVAVLFMAFVIERLTQYLAQVLGLDGKKVLGISCAVIIALVLSGVVAFGANFDFFGLFGIAFSWPYVGCLFTTLLMAGGSNVWHDVMSWGEARKTEAKATALIAALEAAATKSKPEPMPGEDVTGPDPTT